MRKINLVVFCFSALLFPCLTAQCQDSPDVLQLECERSISETVESMETISLQFKMEVDYLVKGLSRVTSEEGDFHFASGKMYYGFKRTFPPLPGRPNVVENEECSFDGSVYYLGKTSGSPSLKKFLGDYQEGAHAQQYYTKQCPCLIGAGFQIPRKVVDWTKEPAISSIVLDYLKIGDNVNFSTLPENDSIIVLTLTIPEPAVKNAQMQNLDLMKKEMLQYEDDEKTIDDRLDAFRTLAQSDQERKVTFHLDRDKHFAVLQRIETTQEGKPVVTVQTEDWKKIDDVWLPQKSTTKTFVANLELLQHFTEEANRTDFVTLSSASFSPREDVQFSLDYGTGTFITDRSSRDAKSNDEGGVFYVQPSSLDDLRKNAAAKKQDSNNLVIILNGVLLLGIICVVIFKLLTKRNSKSA